jgi:dTDP-D-glucose 4,6-dehydratase
MLLNGSLIKYVVSFIVSNFIVVHMKNNVRSIINNQNLAYAPKTFKIHAVINAFHLAYTRNSIEIEVCHNKYACLIREPDKLMNVRKCPM